MKYFKTEKLFENAGATTTSKNKEKEKIKCNSTRKLTDRCVDNK